MIRAAACAVLGLALSSVSGCQPSGALGEQATAEVVAVIDGDTLDVSIANTEARVRVLGIDAPEVGECGADAATLRLRELVPPGASVLLVADPVADDTDRYGRLLRIVDVAGVDVGAQMIDEGLVEAWWPASAATPTRGLQYQATQAEAEADQRGSWGTCASIGR